MKMNKFLAAAFLAVSAMSIQTMDAQTLSPSTKWHWDKGTIVIDTPARPAGQEHVLGLTADPMKTVRVGFVGLGMRGPSAVIRFCQSHRRKHRYTTGITNSSVHHCRPHVYDKVKSFSKTKIMEQTGACGNFIVGKLHIIKSI